MELISYDKLLLNTAFCCMASDGHIDKREIALIKSLCDKSTLFKDFNFQNEINLLVQHINARGKEFISSYFELLDKSNLTQEEELMLIDFAIRTIKADDQLEYSEIKFFKNIRHRLKVSDEAILIAYPDIEQFLEQDLITESYLDTITSQYFETVNFPLFEPISPSEINALNQLSKDQKNPE